MLSSPPPPRLHWRAGALFRKYADIWYIFDEEEETYLRFSEYIIDYWHYIHHCWGWDIFSTRQPLPFLATHAILAHVSHFLFTPIYARQRFVSFAYHRVVSPLYTRGQPALSTLAALVMYLMAPESPTLKCATQKVLPHDAESHHCMLRVMPRKLPRLAHQPRLLSRNNTISCHGNIHRFSQ